METSLLYFLAGTLLSALIFFICHHKNQVTWTRRWTEMEALQKISAQHAQQKETDLNNSLQQAKVEFENLANRLFEQKQLVFQTQGQQQMNLTFEPFRQNLQRFEELIQKQFSQEAMDRHQLKGEIDRLVFIQERMTQETQALTQALKGDNKFQGNWGEWILEQLLERAGLRAGQEYLVQPTLNNEEGKNLRPDIVVLLPDQKAIVIDSKVSLKHFTQIQETATDLAHHPELVKLHLNSIETHIQQLSAKNYAQLLGDKSPDFIFMFIPIEPAWLMALQARPDLSSWAWERGIAVVTSSTLFASLRTVASLWRFENQNKNVLKMSQEVGLLYDKFARFAQDFEKVGSDLRSLEQTYQGLYARLSQGNGNIISRFERIKKLGAKTSKKIQLQNYDADLGEEPLAADEGEPPLTPSLSKS